jgi:hypothetical protein
MMISGPEMVICSGSVIMECWISGVLDLLARLRGQQQVSFSDFLATILHANGQTTQE